MSFCLTRTVGGNLRVSGACDIPTRNSADCTEAAVETDAGVWDGT